MSQSKPAKLGEILLEAGIVDKLQLNTALKYQREWDRKLGEALVELGFITEEVLVKVLSKFLKVPSVDLSQVKISSNALQKVPRRLTEKYGLIPLDVQGDGPGAVLMIAMIDPTNIVAIDEVAFTSSCKIKPVVATHSDIEKAIRRHYGDDRVVDVFFEGSAKASPDHWFRSGQETVSPLEARQERNLEAMLNVETGERPPSPPPPPRPMAKDPEEMVILQGGEEVSVKMPQAPPGRPTPVPSPLNTASLELKLEALLRILARKGILDLNEWNQEIQVLLNRNAS